MGREIVAFLKLEIGGAKDIPYYLGGTTVLYGSIDRIFTYLSTKAMNLAHNGKIVSS
jgi:hypothetical protein